LKKIVKTANQFRKVKILLKLRQSGDISLWVYSNYKRKTLDLPVIHINSKTTTEELSLVQKAITIRDNLEGEGFLKQPIAEEKKPVTEAMTEWANHFDTETSKRVGLLAKNKFIEANGEILANTVSRQHIINTMDMMKKQKHNSNYVRCIASRLRAFCNWAEQRQYCNRVDTRKLLPPEQFGEIKALKEDEIKRLLDTPCDEWPDVKDLFLLGVCTAQRKGEIKNYTFKTLYDGEIRTRQGKTGKFIVIPLNNKALSIMKELKARREKEGLPTAENDKMFRLPSDPHANRIFQKWIKSAGITRDITLRNSRSTAISVLINMGMPESVTQELANHSDPRITARYYRQIDNSRKKESLDSLNSHLFGE